VAGGVRDTSQRRSGADRPARAVPDGYAVLFDEAQDEADRDAVQPALFELRSTAEDVAAAQPLRTSEPYDVGASTSPVGAAGTASGDASAERVVTVGQARRDAGVIASLRDRIAARVAVEAARLRDDTEGDDHDQGYYGGYASEYGVDPEGSDDDYGRVSRETSSSTENSTHSQGMSM
jgi:hypothetical protein